MSTCEKDHKKARCWDSLPNSDDPHAGCDVCPACAFEQGYRDGIRDNSPNFAQYIEILPSTYYPCFNSYGVLIGKKSAQDAYNRGHRLGKQMLDGYLPS